MQRHRLLSKLDYSTIAFQFLPGEFTLTEVQKIYQILLNEETDKRNFRKWALALESVEETGALCRYGRHRPAKRYRLLDPGRVEIIN